MLITVHPHARAKQPASIDTPQRLDWAAAVLARHDLTPTLVDAPATHAQLQAAHDPAYLRGLRALSARGRPALLDPELVVDEHTWPAAVAAAGAVCAGVDHALDAGEWTLHLSRPGSHHAGPGYALGFCVINNLAVGARHALSCGLERVAILDFDVHHGNGTQDIFWTCGQVLCVSMHQHPFFPGTGSPDQTGAGAGRNTTLNLPLAAGAGGREAVEQWRRGLEATVRFAPQLALIQAGLDAHHKDWTSQTRLDAEAFYAIAVLTAQALDSIAAPAVIELGGGYTEDAIRGGLGALLLGWEGKL
jgi:acetoin utilization deacetylase AcuC-like enzyme